MGEEPPLEANPDYNGKTWTQPHRTFGNHLYLNWSNHILQFEMMRVLDLWLSKGVDGFYMKHLENLHVDEPDHIEILLAQFRLITDQHSLNGSRKMLMVSHDSMKRLQSVMDPGTFVRITKFIDVVDASLTLKSNGTDWKIGEEVAEVTEFWRQFSSVPSIVWHVGSVETMRLNNRFAKSSNLATMFLMAFLPGSFSIFYGDEIAMQDSFDYDTLEVSWVFFS
ncbi:aamy domain-containing protein [Caerostris darwini]|uniref:Aamy domain-containing protein n=1 Tax=Caerostris darwini TaxID=1538125 RepID=A0AAV4X2U8_9ARAC|nr:aamy domain-containing protein [Caerostris darwini]